MNLKQTAAVATSLLSLTLSSALHAAPATVTQSGSGFLTVNGTGGADEVRLVGQGSGVVKVVDVASGNTNLGVFSNITGVRVNMKGGDNRLALTDVDIPATLTINGGESIDKVRVNGMLSVGGFLKIALGKGNNRVNGNAGNVTSITVGLNATIDTGSGNDNIGLRGISAKHLTIKAGGGNDKIKVEEHSSILNRLIINAGPGNNKVMIGDTMAVATQVFSGSGNDEIVVLNTQMADFMDLISGGGDDTIYSDTSTAANEYRINCGPGNDSLTSDDGQSIDVDCEIVQPVAPFEFSKHLGDGVCGVGLRLATYMEVTSMSVQACAVLNSFDIARIAGNGSISGSGYGCTVFSEDTRGLGHSVCVNRPSW